MTEDRARYAPVRHSTASLDEIAELYALGKNDPWRVARALTLKHGRQFIGTSVERTIREARNAGDVRFPKMSRLGKRRAGNSPLKVHKSR